MSTATTLLPTRTWLTAPPLLPQPPLLFHSWYKQWKQMSRFKCFLPVSAPAPPDLPPPTRGGRRLFNPPTTDLPHACTLSSLSILSHPYSCSLASALSPILPGPVCFQLTRFSPICPSVSKTGVTETSRPAPSIRRNDQILKKQRCGVEAWYKPVTYLERLRQKDCKLEADPRNTGNL